MKLKGISLTTGGTIKVVEYDNTLDCLHEYVGGYIEYVHIVDNLFLIIDEEGKLKDYGLNCLATDLLGHYKNMFFDIIVGDVLVVATENGDNISLTDEQIETIKEVLK